jgi:hypothetical protein
MSDRSAKRAEEQAIVALAAKAVCRQWGYDIVQLAYPEDEKPPPARPIDGLAFTSGPTIAIEHTLHQSFVDQMQMNTWFQPIFELTDAISGTLPSPGRYDLGIDGAELRGTSGVDLAMLEAWIREQAALLTPGRTSRGVTNVVEGGPPARSGGRGRRA